MNAALYGARLTLKRKRASMDDMREAGAVLNKAVRTLQSWLNNINYHQRGKAEDAESEAWRRLNSVKREGPLIPLHYKD